MGLTRDIGQLFTLAGKVAMISGGSRGLGRAMARTFAAAGAEVIVSSRRQESCDQIVGQIRANGGKAHAIAAHVGRWNEIDRLVERCLEVVDGIDVLVNNAGMSPLYPTPSAVKEELFDKVIGVNLKGPFRLTALVGELMVAAGGGSIINISSTGAVRPSGQIIPYAAAKAGLNAMTIGFADAFGPSVRVNGIMPGRFRTDVAKHWTAEQLSGANAMLKRVGEEDEIVGAALYLASPASSFTTGSLLTVDGGGH
ncbi:SDR family NAD(P)-dependent oxidoreductase [Mycolicibacterium vinylchloridicum]|uniref:SDR family NAD(P)-dependent oxidoreductase n=1 Tax=Mycolicibacterium vinylchloridicum TaxID=2736928 RepID=UPI0015C98695|nr:glucose 1-dehydrogenase [Mycolicibacterium vinylchloridicum]